MHAVYLSIQRKRNRKTYSMIWWLTFT